jgi:hypothetical protein
MNSNWVNIVIPVVVSMFALLIAYILGPKNFMAWDTRHYLEMVTGGTAPAPFAYRVLTPALVKALPIRPEWGFFFTTYLFSFGTLIVLYCAFRNLGSSRLAAGVTTMIVSLTYPIAFYLGNWGLVDPLANFLLALGFLCVINESFVSASVVVSLGVIAKETLLILAPLIFVCSIKHKSGCLGRRFLTATLLSLPPFIAFGILRMSVSPLGGVGNPADILSLWRISYTTNLDNYGLLSRLLREISRSYGFCWVMACFGLASRKDILGYSVYFVGVSLGLCLVATDWSRMLGVGFLGIFIPCSLYLEKIRVLKHHLLFYGSLVLLSMVQCRVSLIGYESLSMHGKTVLVIITVVLTASGAFVCFLAYYRLAIFRRQQS